MMRVAVALAWLALLSTGRAAAGERWDDPLAARRELAALGEDLRALARGEDPSAQRLDAVRIGNALDTFELRHLRRPERVPGWRALREAAWTLLQRRAWRSGFERALALDLVGRDEEALAALRAIVPFECMPWREQAVVAQRVSAILERRGRFAEALAAQRRALAPLLFAHDLADRDLLHLRHGMLLLRCGERAAALPVLQRVADLFPRTSGARVAEVALRGQRALRPPDLARLVSSYARRPDDRLLLLEALAAREPDPCQALVRLLERARGERRLDVIRVLEDLPGLGRRADATLRQVALDDPVPRVRSAALAALGDRADPALLRAFSDRLERAHLPADVRREAEAALRRALDARGPAPRVRPGGARSRRR